MEFSDWLILANSNDSFDRLKCIDEIPDLSNEEVIPVLLKLLEDEHELVRTCAVEMVVEYARGHEAIVKSSIKAMLKKEQDMLTSSYAIISFCEMASEDDLSFIASYFEVASEKYLRLHVVIGLFLVVQEMLVEHFNGAVNDADTPHIKGSSVNLIKYMYERIDSSRTHIADILQKALDSEEDIRMRETMCAVLDNLTPAGLGL